MLESSRRHIYVATVYEGDQEPRTREEIEQIKLLRTLLPSAPTHIISGVGMRHIWLNNVLMLPRARYREPALGTDNEASTKTAWDYRQRIEEIFYDELENGSVVIASGAVLRALSHEGSKQKPLQVFRVTTGQSCVREIEKLERTFRH